MTHYETAVEEFVSFKELAGLAKATAPCVSATLTIPDPAHLRPEMNQVIREIEKQMKESRLDTRTAQTLLEPLREMAATIETDGDWAVALAFYRTTDMFHCFRVPEITKAFVSINQVLAVRPLLPLLSREQRFYLLALSQKKVRLFDCLHYRLQEIELTGRVPQNLRVFLNARMPDRVLDSAGGIKSVMFSTSSEREKQDEYLFHFFNEIDKGLHKILASETAPLLLAGVEYEVALYRRVNTYRHLMQQAVQGSADGVPPRELYERALEIVRTAFSASLEKVVRDLNSHQNGRRVLFDLDEVLDAAYKGRLSAVLLRDNAERRGTCRVAEDKRHEYDLLNLASLQTLLHGGEAYTLKTYEMPDQSDIAALLRY